jgi:hypothetical protein
VVVDVGDGVLWDLLHVRGRGERDAREMSDGRSAEFSELFQLDAISLRDYFPQ